MQKFFLILGAGKFGKLAVQQILKINPQAEIIQVDKNSQYQSMDKRVNYIDEDGIDFLDQFLITENLHYTIIPALPLHVAFAYIYKNINKNKKLSKVRIDFTLDLPNISVGASGDLYTSYADFMCPTDCPEPKNICPVTKSYRGQPMFERIGALQIPKFRVICLPSKQIAPGVGGYKAGELQKLVDKVEKMKGLILIGTACRCHGVLSGLAYQ